jgi:hypothetical protein
MSPTPLDLNSGVIIAWNIPIEIKEKWNVAKVNIYRSNKLNEGYEFIQSLDVVNNEIPTEYKDPNGKRDYYYLVTFVSAPPESKESNYHLTYFYPNPNELRYIYILKSSIPDYLKTNTVIGEFTDYDYLTGLNLGLQYFNSYPPLTYFTLNNFPRQYEYILIGTALMFTVVCKYLPVSARDWTYSEPGGVTMQYDRGSKFQTAFDMIQKMFSQYIMLIKMDLSIDNVQGFGTIPLPLSLGGVIPQGVLNILNLFTSIGR